MSKNPTTARLCAAALTLSLIPTAPAFASDLAERQARRAGTHQIQSVEPQSKHMAMSGSGAFFDVNHTQTVETKRLKRRRTKR